MKKKLVVLVSGNGSNLQAVIDGIKMSSIDYTIEAVVSNKKDAFALTRAEREGIKTLYLPFKKGSSRNEYDALLAEKVSGFKPDYVLLLGWMRILTDSFIASFKDRLINLHPALPGTFPGTEAIERQYEAFMKGEISRCGIMTHFVPDEGVDSGPVIFTEEVPIFENEGLEDFEKRVHEAEHALVIKTLQNLPEIR
ncbi:phosphoribosylglycinamide formyltransferase [Treponema sp. OMZ 791]|uniref:phosphoribosylglycinamide formyltransferase n=1 Tax=unclassified Treponema TaxID=2638727 RepID=UPI0020A33D1C|nr:phosphoribosylglycinamide formyltransferase [Treponema sp. OMZ 791]UTC68482.1 phosphoribosylglycinamide formyltransferase [Treponema sp. OMZ 789]UTC71194.1 phosphoribosylglycinamide formyltransferase [Treponema sp. OMZ 790]UTC73731.1 phosphoribosylglycinamide formyltransferase [Treponema sp. OMZ 791]